MSTESELEKPEPGEPELEEPGEPEPEEPVEPEPEEPEKPEPEEPEKPEPEEPVEPEPEEPEKPEPEKPATKIYYCELCKVPCMSAMILQTHFAGMRHKKRERALKRKCAPVINEEPLSVKRPLSKSIRCLKDYMKDPNREEPLIGLEYVLEVRFQGRRDPCYECQLCQFNTEIVPMIEHLIGQRHRKVYLMKHFPDKGKRNANDPKEDRVRFLRRIAREVEKEEGLKMYKVEGYERPGATSSAAKKRARWSGSFKPENDPVLRQKALEYMDFFEITSDTEATQVIRIAQSLSEALKGFCEKKEALKHIKSLPPLMAPGGRNTKKQRPNKPRKTFDDNPGDTKWTQEHTSSGLAQSQGLLGEAPSGLAQSRGLLGEAPSGLAQSRGLLGEAPSGLAKSQGLLGEAPSGLAQSQGLLGEAPSALYTRQMKEMTSSYTVNSNYLATMSALRKSLAPQSGNSPGGISEWMKQFSQSASASFQSNPVREKSLCSTSSQSSYPTQYPQQSSTQKHDNRMTATEIRSWNSMRDFYSATRDYPASSPSKDFPSWYNNGNNNQMAVSLPAASNSLGWPKSSGYQQPSLQADGKAYQPPFSGGSSYNAYQQQNIEQNNKPTGLSSDIVSQLRGKDPATLARMLQELVPHYPDLQKIDIYTLAQALSRLS
ncbi:PREDICTED: uncharacterized protein LOC107105568 [Gekko japonicus]|uniref:Uncharacterized protein LOC107105568 n=1 Tax=Gekko japonicus TaxID=146911 RepID=A0ABM1JHW6_GEKJA|nr:PREDICTED: uncharacterized protein LOC107105568 [Gekko japonicus]